MPAALTLAEKKERALAKMAERVGPTEEVAKVEATPDNKPQRRRSTFNGTTNKMSVKLLTPGYHPYWFNDQAGRVSQALEGGWEFVKTSEISGFAGRNVEGSEDRIKQLVGTDESGQPLFAYLMKIRQDWYDEDQAALQERNDSIDSAIRRGKNAENSEGFYVPKDGISLKNSTNR